MHDMKAIFKKHVKKHKRKILLGSPIIILIIVLDAFNFFANEKTALILLPEPSRFVTVDRSFATTVKLVARTAVNAVGGSIRFNSENADILDVSQKNSIINLWAEELTPLFSSRNVGSSAQRLMPIFSMFHKKIRLLISGLKNRRFLRRKEASVFREGSCQKADLSAK